jgi:hypothetical protein
MARALLAFLIFGLVGVGDGADRPEPPQGDVPELVVSLAPATGLLPLDSEQQAIPYRFQIAAFDQDRSWLYGTAETFVWPGQERTVDRNRLMSRVRGKVRLGSDGMATYTAELLLNGRIAARTSATVRVPALP